VKLIINIHRQDGRPENLGDFEKFIWFLFVDAKLAQKLWDGRKVNKGTMETLLNTDELGCQYCETFDWNEDEVEIVAELLNMSGMEIKEKTKDILHLAYKRAEVAG